MKIRTKLVLSTTLFVSAAIIFLTSGAAYINQSQTEEANRERLKISIESLNLDLAGPIDELEKRYSRFIKSVRMSRIASVVEEKDLKEVQNAFELSKVLVNDSILFGKSAGIPFGFFSNFTSPQSTPKLIYQYLPDQGGLVVNNSILIVTNFGVESTKSDKILSLPEFKPFDGEVSIQTVQKQPTFIVTYDFVYQGKKDRRSGIKVGDKIGEVVLVSNMTLDFMRKGRDLGVKLNIYDIEGKGVYQQIPYDQLDLTNEDSIGKIINLTDQNNASYNTIIKAILFKDKIIGYISIHISRAATNQKVFATILWLSAIAVVVLVIVGVISYFWVRRLTSPMQVVVNLLKDIAEGEGDLTKRLKVSGKDEIGELAHWFNIFIIKVQEIVTQVQNDSNTLSSSAEQLSASTIEMQTGSSSISNAIHEEASATHESSEIIGSLVISLESVFEKMKEVQGVANKAEQHAIKGNEVVGKTTSMMKNIEQSRQEIQGVTGVITEIANQINLLSLNAAIEAAKAGDSGRGFAVVADEIRSLADRSSAAVVKIQKSVDNSSESVEEGMIVIKETQHVLTQIIDYVQKISSDLNKLSIEISDQERGIQEVSTSVKRISHLSEENASSSEELSNTLNEIALTTQDLSNIAEQLMGKVELFKV